MTKDYYDINSWSSKATKYALYITNKGLDKAKFQQARPFKVDTVKLYSLLKAKICPTPNGFFTLMQNGLPLDNMIWWDFLLESDHGFIHVWRTSSAVEATYFFDGKTFDLHRFFEGNFSKYRADIEMEVGKFDKHTVYLNHFKSYKDCVEFLWNEIKDIDLTPPVSPTSHAMEKSVIEEYLRQAQQFVTNSVKFHTLGKSLVLNAAFEIESFLNLLIRVGATPELRDFPDVLKKHLNNTIGDKLKNLKFYSRILRSNVDLENRAIKDALELMTLRNKYVHFDENSIHNKIGEVYFDNDFPLQPTSEESPAVEVFKQIAHRPDFTTVKKSYDTAGNFTIYMKSLILPEFQEDVMFLMNQNPIGYNETRKVYSGISNELITEFYLPLTKR